MPTPIRLKITVIPSALPPAPVQRKLLDAIEGLRIAVARLEQMHDDPRCEGHECAGDFFIRAVIANIGMYVSVFQELIGGVLPSLPERVFNAVRDFQDRWAENVPGSEGSLLALTIAERSFRAALRESSKMDEGAKCDDLDELMLAAAETVSVFCSQMETHAPFFERTEVIVAILDDGELPEFMSLEAIAEWRRVCREKRLAKGIPDERFAAAGITVDQSLPAA